VTSGTAARDQGPGTGTAPHSAGTLVFVSSDGPVEVDASVVDQNIDCAEPMLGLSDGVASLRMGDVEREGKPGVGEGSARSAVASSVLTASTTRSPWFRAYPSPLDAPVRSHVEVSM
jgi:hypothetical protein